MGSSRLMPLALCLLLWGCTVPTKQPVDRPAPPLIVARAGDVAVLSWQTEAGNLYSVLFADGIPAQWRPLPGLTRIPGNGREFRAEDNVPARNSRQYRLMIEPASR